MDTSWKRGNGRTIADLMAMKRIKVGTVIEFEHNDQIMHYLIGDVNDQLGGCDCCGLAKTTVVRRYRAIPYKAND